MMTYVTETLRRLSNANHWSGALFFASLTVACGGGLDMTTVGASHEIEVAPDKWITVNIWNTVHTVDLKDTQGNPHQISPADAIKQLAEHTPISSSPTIAGEGTRLSFEWNRRKVTWQGNEIPITLREYGGDLFMIGINREVPGLSKFIFFQINPGETGFDRIQPGSFPRQIATQNMWMNVNGRFFRVGQTLVDEWEVLRTLDVESPYFDHSLTAYVWYQIETGVEKYDMPRLIDETFIREYVRKYEPIALPTIVKE